MLFCRMRDAAMPGTRPGSPLGEEGLAPGHGDGSGSVHP